MVHTTIALIPEDEDSAAAWLETHEEKEEEAGAGNWGLRSTTRSTMST
jgi:hypothetical protein